MNLHDKVPEMTHSRLSFNT